MKRAFLIISIFLLYRSIVIAKAITIDLYGKSLSVEVGNVKTLERKFALNDKGLKECYSLFKSENYEVISSILSIKQQLNLDDWFILKIVDALIEKDKPDNAVFLKWFVLGEMGYMVQVLFLNKQNFLFVASDQSLFNVPRAGRYYCLDCSANFGSTVGLTSAKFNPYWKNKKSFSFQLKAINSFFSQVLPDSSYIVKHYEINDSTEIDLKFLDDVLNVQKDFPKYNMRVTFDVPLSKGTENVIKEIKKVSSGFSDVEKVNYVMRFISSNSYYSSDQDVFGKKDEWMTPEQFLFYGKGDCEDKSSFLFYALKVLLDKPLIIISYPSIDHINIGISLDIAEEPDLVYKGNKYFICEVTVGSGFIPIGTYKWNRALDFNIVGEYIPSLTGK